MSIPIPPNPGALRWVRLRPPSGPASQTAAVTTHDTDPQTGLDITRDVVLEWNHSGQHYTVARTHTHQHTH